MYSVLNDNNVMVELNDSDIQKNIKEGLLKRETIMAMGISHKEEYLQYLYPYLDSESFFIRRDAAQSIFLINGKKGLPKLKEREKKLKEEDYNNIPSEKALLGALIIQIEGGTKGTEEYFFSAQGNINVKYVQAAFYTSGYLYKEEDIRLIVKILEAYLNKDLLWIKNMSKEDYLEAILFLFQSIWYAYKETDCLRGLAPALSERLCVVCEQISNLKMDSFAKEMIADIASGVQKESAVKILKILSGKVKGDAKKAFKRSLKYWNIEESDLNEYGA